MSKPYRIVEIAYDRENEKYPWMVIRTGTVAEQGGLAFGTETAHYQTLKDACTDIEQMVTRDIPVINTHIDYKEAQKAERDRLEKEARDSGKYKEASSDSDCPNPRKKDKGKHNWRTAMGDLTYCDSCHVWWNGVYDEEKPDA